MTYFIVKVWLLGFNGQITKFKQMNYEKNGIKMIRCHYYNSGVNG